jgi:hypothetical protein
MRQQTVEKTRPRWGGRSDVGSMRARTPWERSSVGSMRTLARWGPPAIPRNRCFRPCRQRAAERVSGTARPSSMFVGTTVLASAHRRAVPSRGTRAGAERHDRSRRNDRRRHRGTRRDADADLLKPAILKLRSNTRSRPASRASSELDSLTGQPVARSTTMRPSSDLIS